MKGSLTWRSTERTDGAGGVPSGVVVGRREQPAHSALGLVADDEGGQEGPPVNSALLGEGQESREHHDGGMAAHRATDVVEVERVGCRAIDQRGL